MKKENKKSQRGCISGVGADQNKTITSYEVASCLKTGADGVQEKKCGKVRLERMLKTREDRR